MTSTHTLAVAALALAEAEQDYELWQRLTSAERRLKQATQEHAQALADHTRIETATAEAVKAARFDGLSDLRIAREGPADENLVRAAFEISYTKAGNDGRGVMAQRHTIPGFKSLDPIIFAWLIEKHPENIPAEILALAPGDPHAAFGAYFSALRRGYTTSPKAAA
jgi:hypothetical protein